VTYEALIEVNPTDAGLKIDGNDVRSDAVQLLAGPHQMDRKEAKLPATGNLASPAMFDAPPAPLPRFALSLTQSVCAAKN